MKRLLSAALAAALLSSSGCYSRMGDLTVLSNRNLSAPLSKTKRVVGKSCAWMFFGLAFGSPDLEEAADDAMNDDPQAEVLTDVEVSRGHEGILLIGRNCIRVEGTLAKANHAEPQP